MDILRVISFFPAFLSGVCDLISYDPVVADSFSPCNGMFPVEFPMLEPEHDFIGRTEYRHDFANSLAVAEFADRTASEIVVAPVPVQLLIKMDNPVHRILRAMGLIPRFVFFQIPSL